MINLNSPLKISKNITLKNRVVIPPMASATATKKGYVTAKTIKHYEKLSRGEQVFLWLSIHL